MIKELMPYTPFAILSLSLLTGIQAGGPGSGSGQTGEAAPALSVVEFPNATELRPGVWGGGQPTREQLQAAAAAGVKSVVNLRPLTEEGAWDERAYVEELGMRYVHIPVAGPAEITEENADLLAAVIDDAQARPVLIHCASGKRAGALFALAQRAD